MPADVTVVWVSEVTPTGDGDDHQHMTLASVERRAIQRQRRADIGMIPQPATDPRQIRLYDRPLRLRDCGDVGACGAGRLSSAWERARSPISHAQTTPTTAATARSHAGRRKPGQPIECRPTQHLTDGWIALRHGTRLASHANDVAIRATARSSSPATHRRCQRRVSLRASNMPRTRYFTATQSSMPSAGARTTALHGGSVDAPHSRRSSARRP